MARYITSLIMCVLLSACALESGKQLSAPLSAALGTIKSNATSVLASGAAPQDKRVVAIVKAETKAEQQVVTISKQVDNANAKLAKSSHRIFIDDCIFGAVAAAILLPIVIKLIPMFV